ncbi:CynX/NimT family MFS transporter [Salmonella enterica subsp. enterica serovar Kentucky]|uniref:CynX/NimT family MFS transporter n=1 Tax=Salmonella enterica subsp. enterica serovar Kentucky TaxID=192955 RepID=A0A631VH73_SALET|nr:CynX/NimT family MFS transporter [Salmonella enterica subsp. enterica serovar Kentucky]EBO2693086.1 CynX/NimT family MFS transporter [Salmonella enterica subsp. enterica serovar Kentucky]EDG6193645.1 CynX/NimT family MFS transporter [Salmonella enterica subsp. enterica serovar Kentucky]EDG7390233.1 CynX/NimT family MFS transporter [Salmonella enterica subsp. enterica serovar Kentucky]EEM4471803.1 CynX/NimT family MFS transporter [Salmonella enterica subsp. enterica serovar Kentucky]
MTTALSPRGKQGALLIAGILMIATTLRVTFTGAAPLLETIRSDYGLSTAQTGLLTTLPLLAFALVSPLAAGIARRFGMERSLFAAMLLICADIALRSLPSAALLFAGTAIIGCGIALGNVLLPGLIKRDFSQHVARLTGAYSLTMGAAAALGSALVVPLALHGFGWRGALLMLMLFPLLAFLIWLPQWRTTRSANLSSSRALHERGIWRSPLAWQVTLFLGLNSLIYYVIIGWLPTILISHGYSEAQAGSLHGLLQLATAAPGLAIPLILHRFNDQRWIAALVSLLCAVGAAGLWFVPGQAVIWTLLFGFGSGATMILGLTFIGLRASSAHQAAALSGMAQSVGYLLAACGPPVMGKLHDASGSWYLPLSGVTVLAIIMAIFGLYAGRDREIAS